MHKHNGLCSHALSDHPLPLLGAVGAGTLNSKQRSEETTRWSLPKFLRPANTTCLDHLFGEEGMAVPASKTSSHPRGKEEEIGALVSLGLGKNKNAVSCQNPAAEPVLLISIRAAITTLPSLGACIASPLREE